MPRCLLNRPGAAPGRRQGVSSMLATAVQPVVEFFADQLRVVVHEDRSRLGRAVANDVAQAIEVDVHLRSDADIAADHLHLIPGESQDHPQRVAMTYADLVERHPGDIVCGGIGDNGHLAFNDPHSADFRDPLSVKVVRLDERCRAQQLADHCFGHIDEVPTHAYTWTIPALLKAPIQSIVVPGARKAQVVLATVRGPIGEHCPATILRNHPGATLHLDRESARLLL